MKHIPVLLAEAIAGLELKPDSVVVDCTLGGGGHARKILEFLGEKGTYVGIDADPAAVAAAIDLKASPATVHLVNDNFTNLVPILQNLAVQPTAILADLGWRTDQFEEGKKGFSFSKNDPLLMTFGDPENYTFTAADIVNDWSEDSLIDIIRGYGEERFATRIARGIVNARTNGKIQAAEQLSNIIIDAVPGFYRRGRIHPATRTFQALRITVNDELGSLKKLLEDSLETLSPHGRLAIISFHSLEDRIVKQFFNQKIDEQKADRITKKPIMASAEEIERNPRSRSAKLRIIEKI
ncbi:MAG: 16S rRNA (cytosine(1402)-N(4))-methyltransferase RsmH [Candidatus Paceibacterota bacterium]